VYPPEQIRGFLVAVEGDRLQAMWCLVLATGLRRAELAGLRWRDVALDRDPPTLAVRSTRTTARHEVVVHDPKSRSSRRVLYLDSWTADVLRCHRAAMAVEVEQRDEHALPEYVFVDEFGDPFHPARLTRDLHNLQRRAGLPEIPFHDLRHTAAAVALLAGVHPQVVSERHTTRPPRSRRIATAKCWSRCRRKQRTRSVGSSKPISRGWRYR